MISWLVALSVTSLPSISGQRVPWKVPSAATAFTNARPYCCAEREHREVIGAYAELAERWGKRLPRDFDPHKPFIDGYTWSCRHCGGTMRRVPEVIDAWFDSGAMPYAQWHYPFEHQADFKAHFPADFICEGVDQTRGWFYSLL